MKVYPHLAQSLYAVYVGAQPRARLSGIFTSKNEANKKKKALKHKHAISLRGAQHFHVVVVKYVSYYQRFSHGGR
jgi:hypothetical protein